MSGEWEETRARLEAATTGRRIYQGTLDELAADIRAALQRVQELEAQYAEVYAECARLGRHAQQSNDARYALHGELEAAEARVQELEHESADRAELIDNLLEQKESCQKCIEKALHNKKRAEAAEEKLARCVEALESNRSLRDTLHAALAAAKGE